jgi:hypothetical protein
MRRVLSIASISTVVILTSGCAATTTLGSVQKDATIDVSTTKQSTIPRTETISATSFGNYEFRAKAGTAEPFYGILPLKFNGGYLALDILFFTPLLFFNLREVYPYYEFDIEKMVVKYKYKEADEWNTYTPLQVEIARAKEFFKDK